MRNMAMPGEAEILIYEEIGRDFWDEGIGAKQFVEDLKALGDLNKITLRINSPGGSVFEGNAIYNALVMHKATIEVYIDGLAASIASVIAMAGVKSDTKPNNKIIMPANSMLMIHDPWMMAQGSAEDMRKAAEALDKIKLSIIASYRAKTGLSDEEIADIMSAETWLTAYEALEKGFCDEVTEAAEMAACSKFNLSGFKNVPAPLRAAGTVDTIQIAVGDNAAGNKPKEGNSMNKCKHCGAVLDEAGACPVCAAKAAAEAQAKVLAQANQERIEEIKGLAKKYNCEDSALDAISSGMSVSDFKGQILEKKMGAAAAQPIDVFMSQREQSQYSVARAIVNSVDKIRSGFEMEVSDEIGRQLKRTTNGVFIPLRLGGPRNVLSTASSEGGATVATELQELIDVLRNRMLVRQMGAQVLSGLSGNVAFPRKTGTGTLYWVGENPESGVTAGDATFDQLIISPKTAQATTSFSRQLLTQSSLDVEAMVRQDLMDTAAIGIDNAAINGTGQNNQPTGILNTSNIGAVVGGTDGALPTWAHMVALESKIAAGNADFGSLGYLTNPKVRGILKTTAKFTNTGLEIWQKGQATDGFGEVNGYRAGATMQVPSTLTKGSSTSICSAIIFGNWADLIIGEFGVIEVTVDPYTLADKGQIKVTIHVMVDLGVRHAASFAAMKDALTTGQ
jgi:HK97 family phage major capsid protein/ATP-dependent Clp endopeptidase proteolytic subunit ClpP